MCAALANSVSTTQCSNALGQGHLVKCVQGIGELIELLNNKCDTMQCSRDEQPSAAAAAAAVCKRSESSGTASSTSKLEAQCISPRRP
jgi:hypothetical protein